MQSNFLKFAATAAVTVFATAAFAQIKWAPSYDAAVKQAKAEKKLVMIEFYTAWDLDDSKGPAWSGRMEEDTFKAPAVQKLAKKVVPVRLDVEKEGKGLGAKYNITNYPTVLFVSPSGVDMGRVDGYEPPEEFTDHVDKFLKDYAKEPALRAKYKKQPKDLDTITALGIIEADRYKATAAINKLHEAELIDPSNKTGKLSDLYSAIADIYQNAGAYDAAIRYFKKAAATSTKTTPKAYALLSIATCYMSKEGPLDPNPSLSMDVRRDNVVRNCKMALPYVQQTLKLPNLAPADKDIAENDLAQIKQILDAAGQDG